VEGSGAVSGSCRKMMERSTEREYLERGVGVTEIGCSAEWLFRHSHALYVIALSKHACPGGMLI